jgi:putative dimethyl sulfoxide reductase chaperone
MSNADSLTVITDPAPRERRSVFGNYPSGPDDVVTGRADTRAAMAGVPGDLEGCADLAVARSFVHQFLARAFDYPEARTWLWLTGEGIQEALASAVEGLEADPGGVLRTARGSLARVFVSGAFEVFHDDYIAAIGHAARGSCPINEIEYGDIKADPLFQPHRLADLAAFYRAFGLELGAVSDERHDHLSVEFEFMGVLTAQEAHLLNTSGEPEALVVCRTAQSNFLREHLGRWTPAFARRLCHAVGDGPLGALARFALAFAESECRRWGVTPGSADLLLRPADEAASLCDGCGLAQGLPGMPAEAAVE